MARALRDGQGYNEQEIVVERPDGSRRTALAYANPVRDADGRVTGAVNVLVDITERRRAEEATRRANQTLAALIQASPLPTVVIDADPPVVRLWNPAAERLFGWPEADVLGRVIPIVPDEQLEECEHYCSVVAAGQSFQGAETRRLNKAGTLIDVSISAAPLHEPDGRLRGILLLFADITERKRAETALREADHRKDEFLATLAHELRNPLAPLRNALHILGMAGPDADVAAQARGLMDRQLRQMVRLIDDLLDVSRITRGKLQLRTERVELAAVVRNAVETARPLVETSGHALSVELPPQPLYVEADPLRLAQVFANLLNNAAKYTEPGGQIRVRAGRQGNDAVVVVEDNGIGIPAEALPRIFEMFNQVDRSLERSNGGLGIGLTLVRRLVEMHGGTVEAVSDGPDRGSRFTVRLPAVITAPAVAARGEVHAPPAGPCCRALVADDNQDAAASLALVLRLMGHEVRTVNDGQAAVEEAETFRPDVVLMDIGMPRLNGYDAARRIREQPWGRAMVLIALTGWGQEEDRRRAQKAGFTAHAVKPVDPSVLQRLLAGLLCPVV